MNYAYNEEEMLKSIAAMKGKPGRPKLRRGCKVHGNVNMRRTTRGHNVCRICLAAFSRKNYAKNSERIKAQKREYYRRKAA